MVAASTDASIISKEFMNTWWQIQECFSLLISFSSKIRITYLGVLTISDRADAI